MSLLDDPITWGQAVAFAAGWLTFRGVRWWRRNVAWQHTGAGFRAERITRTPPPPSDQNGA